MNAASVKRCSFFFLLDIHYVYTTLIQLPCTQLSTRQIETNAWRTSLVDLACVSLLNNTETWPEDS